MLKKETREILKLLLPISESAILKYPITNINSFQKDIIAFIDLKSLGESQFEEFGIYKLAEFLQLLDLFPDSEITLNNGVIIIQNDKITQRYLTTHIDNLKDNFDIPDTILKKISEAPKVAEIDIEKKDLENIKKISSLLKLMDLNIESKNKELSFIINNKSNPEMNSQKIKVNSAKIYEDFKIILDIEAIQKIPTTSYKITIARNKKTGSYITLWELKKLLFLKIVISTKIF